MKQLKLPFEESNVKQAERVFKEMLNLSPDNPQEYSVEHMINWLNEYPKKELYVSSITNTILARYQRKYLKQAVANVFI